MWLSALLFNRAANESAMGVSRETCIPARQTHSIATPLFLLVTADVNHFLLHSVPIVKQYGDGSVAPYRPLSTVQIYVVFNGSSGLYKYAYILHVYL